MLDLRFFCVVGIAVRLALAIAASDQPASQPASQPGGMPDVQFVVRAPDEAGDSPQELFCSLSIDGWPEGGRAIRRLGEGLYAATWELPRSTVIEYKFLRGKSWDKVEKAHSGAELPNRRLVTAEAGSQVVFHCVQRWADLPAGTARMATLCEPGGASPPRAATRTGDIRVHADVYSPQLENRRRLQVYLPPGYAEHTDTCYPVLYLHDGNNVFDAATSFTGIEWGADETAERLIRAGTLPALIMVAIDNNADRMNEYTPFRDATRATGGRGDEYLRFIVETVKPMIDGAYRTQTDREHTAIAGSSLGGLISLYAVVKFPETFGAAGVISPALWWNERRILDLVRQCDMKRPIRLWIDIGTAEGRSDGPLAVFTRAVGDCRDLVAILEAKGLRAENDYHYEEIDGGLHNEAAWAARFERALLYLSGK